MFLTEHRYDIVIKMTFQMWHVVEVNLYEFQLSDVSFIASYIKHTF